MPCGRNAIDNTLIAFVLRSSTVYLRLNIGRQIAYRRHLAAGRFLSAHLGLKLVMASTMRCRKLASCPPGTVAVKHSSFSPANGLTAIS